MRIADLKHLRPDPGGGRADLPPAERLIDGLGVVFYVAMLIAFLIAVTGSPGWGFLFLLFGSAALVVRTTIENLGR